MPLSINGEELTLRPIRPNDEAALRAAFDGLSRESRYARFRGLTALTDAQWRYLTHVDDVLHVALVAVTEGGEIVGVGRFVRLGSDLGKAELALTVADRFQRRGLGQALLAALLPLARSCGLHTFVAFTGSDNLAIARIFRSRGGRRVSMHQGEAVYELGTALPVYDAA